MSPLALALFKSLAGFARPGLWRYLLLPPLLAGLVWVVANLMWLAQLARWLGAETPLAWLQVTLGAWHLGWFASVLAFVGAWIILLAGAYLIAIVLVGVWALPALVARVAATDYPDLAARGSDDILRSLGVTFKASAVYLIGWAATLPIWIIPGMAVVHSLFWLAYLNRATFAFDAVASHADPGEWQRLSSLHSGPLWMLGLIAGLLAHLPLIGLLAPTLAAMGYVHYGLEALRAERRGAADRVIEGQVIEVIRE
jgi:CysZ protein